MGPAVVLGQDLAEAAGSVRDGAAADLAAGNRKMGYGHRETAGTGLAHHLHDARPERLTLRAPRGSAAALDRAVRNRDAIAPVSSVQIALISTRSQRHERAFSHRLDDAYLCMLPPHLAVDGLWDGPVGPLRPGEHGGLRHGGIPTPGSGRHTRMRVPPPCGGAAAALNLGIMNAARIIKAIQRLGRSIIIRIALTADRPQYPQLRDTSV
jgi:hypothetical protein